MLGITVLHSFGQRLNPDLTRFFAKSCRVTTPYAPPTASHRVPGASRRSGSNLSRLDPRNRARDRGRSAGGPCRTSRRVAGLAGSWERSRTPRCDRGRAPPCAAPRDRRNPRPDLPDDEARLGTRLCPLPFAPRPIRRNLRTDCLQSSRATIWLELGEEPCESSR